MKIIKDYTKVNFDEIIELYYNAQWNAYTEDMSGLEKAIRNSQLVYLAVENNEVIGIIRVVGDGVSILYIQDIIVHSKARKNGVGTRLIREILKDNQHVRQVVLLCDNREDTISFYESNGFYRSTDMNCISFVKFNK